jgi:hypothetical protein
MSGMSQKCQKQKSDPTATGGLRETHKRNEEEATEIVTNLKRTASIR